MHPAILLLTDSRLPVGGHAHSGGVEQAVALGLVHDLPSLSSFLRGRLHTARRPRRHPRHRRLHLRRLPRTR
ncbi:hypothetical protein ACFSTC_42740 [Nonomuraea ferruginea]